MKRLYTFLIFIMITYCAQSQSIEWYIQDSVETTIAGSVVQLNDGSFFIINGTYNYNKKYLESNVNIYTNNGALSKSESYNKEGQELELYFAIHDSINERILTISNLEVTDDSCYILVTLWDYSLNIINEDQTYIGDTTAWHLEGNISQEDEVIIVGNVGLMFMDNKNVFIKVKLSTGEILLTKEYLLNVSTKQSRGIVRNVSNNGYLTGGGTNFYHLDDSLNIISSIRKRVGQSVQNQFTINKWSSNSYIFGGSNTQPIIPNVDKNISIVEIDDSLNVIKYNTFGIDWDFGFARKSLDWQDKNNLYFVGFSIKYGMIKLFNLNEELEVNWQQEYRMIEGCFYLGWELIATNDGGCIMVGRGECPYYESFILKIKNDHVGTSTLPDGISHVITLFPNPSLGDLEIDIQGADDVDMRIYDMQGKQLIHRSGLKRGLNSFSQLNIPPGIYNIQLLDNDKIISNQRWSKM